MPIKQFRAPLVLLTLSALLLASAQREGFGQDKKKKKNEAPVQKIFSEEFVIPKLGVKVRDMRDIVHEDGPDYIREISPRVTAVLEKGAAYYAGITPGDEFQFVNRRSSFTSAELAEGIAKAHSRDFSITIIYKVFDFTRPYYSTSIDVYVLDNEPADGNWITTVPTHSVMKRGRLEGSDRAGAEAQSSYDRLLNESVASIVSAPCQLIDGFKYGAAGRPLDDIAEDLQTWRRRGAARSEDRQSTGAFLGDVWKATCENSKEGELPALERALWAMTFDPTLDACSYSEANDYRSVFQRPANLRYYSKTKYREHFFARFNAYVGKLAPAQKTCFYNLLKTAMAGK